jgi:hypothetical protein
VKQVEELRTQPVAPYEDYAVSPVYASAAAPPEQIGKITRGVPTGAANGDGFDSSLVETRRIEEPLEAAPSSASAFERPGPLSEAEAFQALREFRDTVIARETENWEPHRSLLRESMMETLVIQRVRDPDDWFRKVPQFQRAGTNALEKQRYFDQVCEIIDRIADDDNPGPNHSPSGVQRSLRVTPHPSSDDHSLQ